MADASAIVGFLTGGDKAERIGEILLQPGGDAVAPAHLDAEVLSALARMARAGLLSEADVDSHLRQLEQLPIDRLAIDGTVIRAAWRLRDNVAIADAVYVATALGFGGRVVTLDQRLARAVPDVVVDLES